MYQQLDYEKMSPFLGQKIKETKNLVVGCENGSKSEFGSEMFFLIPQNHCGRDCTWYFGKQKTGFILDLLKVHSVYGFEN